MLDLAEYDRAHAAYKAYKPLLDSTLYDLCAKHPGHTDRREVHAKFCIVNRTYAAGLERSIGVGGLSSVVDHVLNNRDRMGKIIRHVRALKGPLNPDKLEIILRAHAQLDSLMSEITQKGHSVRSFASKYLHFHNPLVPIYDALAWASLRELAPRAPKVLPKNGDRTFRRFLERFWSLHRELRRAGRKPTARRIDSYLLYRGA
jgi:hypothetical protein